MVNATRRSLDPRVLIVEETGWAPGSTRTGFENRKSVAPIGVSIPGRSGVGSRYTDHDIPAQRYTYS